MAPRHTGLLCRGAKAFAQIFPARPTNLLLTSPEATKIATLVSILPRSAHSNGKPFGEYWGKDSFETTCQIGR